MLGLQGGLSTPDTFGEELAFVFSVKTDNTGTSNDDQFTMPVTHVGSGANKPFINIDWGDDSTNADVQTTITHTYSSAGTYIIKVLPGTSYTAGVDGSLVTYPALNRFAFANGGDRLKLLDIKNWGIFAGNTTAAFHGCENMTCSAVDIPTGCDFTTNKPTSFLNMFRTCKKFNGVLNQWKDYVSTVTTFKAAFLTCHAFNQPLGDWDTSNATSLQQMFQNALVYDQDLGSWDIESVTNFTNFMNGNTELSTANYNAILIGWQAQTVSASEAVHFGNATSSGAGTTAKNVLIDTDGWTFTDGD